MDLRHQVTNTDTSSQRHARSAPTSSKLSKAERVTDNLKPISGVSPNAEQGRTNMNMQGGKPPSSGSSQQSKGPEPNRAGKGQSNEDVGTESESERLKGQCFEGDVLLKWGQKKRQRNGRLETKANIAEDCSLPAKKLFRVDRRVQKSAGAVQTQTNTPNKGHLLRSSTPNGHDATCGNLRSVTARAENGNTLERANDGHIRRSSPVKKLSTVKRHDRELTISTDEPDNAVACNKSGSRGSYTGNIEEQADVDFVKGAAVIENISVEFFEWPKFFISLSRKEKEDDFFVIKGCKLPQRPKRRSKHIEKVLHFVSPGAWLCDLTRERYEVRERKTMKKKPRGLKAMGSADSDSE